MGSTLDRNQQSSSNNGVKNIFTANRKPADFIRGCSRGQTLYMMFGLDGKYKLLERGGPMDEYDNLVNSIRQMIASQKVPKLKVRDIRIYGRDMSDTLERLEKIHLPKMNSTAIEQVVMPSTYKLYLNVFSFVLGSHCSMSIKH